MKVVDHRVRVIEPVLALDDVEHLREHRLKFARQVEVIVVHLKVAVSRDLRKVDGTFQNVDVDTRVMAFTNRELETWKLSFETIADVLHFFSRDVGHDGTFLLLTI